MHSRHWILLVGLLTVAYAATAPVTNSEIQQPNQELVRQKRFLLPMTALLGAKALIGTAAWSAGLAQGAIYGGTVLPVYIHHPYPVYRSVYTPSHGYY